MKKVNGFTLVELMVVVVIVTILSAVAIPLLGIPRKRAMSSEAMTGMGVIQTYMRCYYADKEQYTDDMDEFIPVMDSLDGNFFLQSDYSIELTGGGAGYLITCSGSQGYVNGVVVTLDHEGSWSISYDE